MKRLNENKFEKKQVGGRRVSLALIGLLLTATARVTLAAGGFPPAEDLLKAADRSRGAAASSKGISWTALVHSEEEGAPKDVTYQIRGRGDNALAEVTAPARQKGEIMLFNDRNIWFFKPGIKKPVSISPRQKLLGQASNGDIASTNYARDYDGTVISEESLNGSASYRLDLKARAKNVTYDKIRYWINKSTRLGVRAEFLTVSGEIFKTAEFKYENAIKVGGDKFPFVSEMRIQDAANEKNVTTVKYDSPREDNHSESLFNVNNLVR